MALQIAYYFIGALGIYKKKSKLLTIVMMIMMWLVYGLCTYNGDFGNYSWIYDNIQNPGYWAEFELFYNIFMYLCRIGGLNFVQFRMVFGAVYIVLLCYAISKYTENIAESLGLYMLFPFLSFVSIVRSGFATVFIVLAYHEIIAGKNNQIKFWVLMITAALFQYTSIFFVFYYFMRKKSIKPYVAVLVFGLVFIAFAAYYSGIIYRVASMVTSSERTLVWFLPGGSKQKVRWGIYLVIIDLMVILLAFLSRNDNRIASRSFGRVNPYAEDIYYLSLSMIIFIPTFFVTSNASARLIWQMLLFIIICYARDDECRFPVTKWTKLQFSRATALLIVFLLFFSYYANLPYKGTKDDARLVFQNNLIYVDYVNPYG